MFSAATKSAAPVSAAKYIENFFQTWLRTGTGASATITTGLDASTNKALVWTKSRSAATEHELTDTVRGATKSLRTNATGAQATDTNGLTAFSSTGYTIGTDTNYNNSGATYVDWEFVATPKFFDVVTYTGDGNTSQTIAHNLGSVPGSMIVKRTDSSGNWLIYHQSLGATKVLLFDTSAAVTSSLAWNNTAPTSTNFTVGNSASVNASGGTYVAYLFAHNAGGFGLTGTDNVISCGSFTTDGSGNATVNLGYEPQWLLIKPTGTASSWFVSDNMRGMSNPQYVYTLSPNNSSAENTADYWYPTATGFSLANSSFYANAPCIYIAIRRGPMKVPTSGTSVFNPNAYTATGVGNRNFTDVGFSPDWSIFFDRSNSVGNSGKNITRLLGSGNALNTTATSALQTGFDSYFLSGYNNNGYTFGSSTGGNGQLNGANGDTKVFWNFGRAPGFFDVVCYTGTGSATTQTHNLGAAPEMMIVKRRNSSTYGDWYVYAASQGATKFLLLNLTDAVATNSGPWNNTAPTSSVFTAGSDLSINTATYVAYLFASVAGVSKIGSYTGTGALQTINCGFTSGARFVLIKRTDSTGDWWVYDSARGITSGNDPYLLLNSTAAEVTGTNYVDTDTTGFKVTAAAPAGLNANGGTFLFLAIS